jgi:GNAT superfamily N-acetyltransferase
VRLKEFAPSPERDHNDDVPDPIFVLANRWWNATDKQPQIEHVLNSMGWSIHQVESEDDAVQLQHRNGTTHFISADDFDPDLFEISDELRRDYLHHAGRHVDRRLNHMARVRDRLNKGYEIYHADRPAGPKQIVDRFDADTPALARQYYEKFIQDYVSDVDFDLRLRRATGIIEDTEPTVKQAHRDGVDLTAHRHGNELTIDADAHGRNLARVVFDVAGKTLVARDLLVDEAYRGQGIAAVMYDYAKDLGYQVKRSHEQTDAGKHFWDKNRGHKRVWETELDEIARIPQSELGGWGDKDTLAPMTDLPKNRKPLPGGSQFTYAVNRKDPEFMEIMIFDGDTLAAELDLFATLDPLKTWGVETVVTDPDYRGRGLGKALYGIALSILKLTIEAGETQTKFGQAMWLMLDSIPGVEVLGYAMARTPEYRARPGDKVVDQNDTWTRYTFPVEPGKRSMRSTRPGTGIYSSQHVSMIAKWTGR